MGEHPTVNNEIWYSRWTNEDYRFFWHRRATSTYLGNTSCTFLSLLSPTVSKVFHSASWAWPDAWIQVFFRLSYRRDFSSFPFHFFPQLVTGGLQGNAEWLTSSQQLASSGPSYCVFQLRIQLNPNTGNVPVVLNKVITFRALVLAFSNKMAHNGNHLREGSPSFITAPQEQVAGILFNPSGPVVHCYTSLTASKYFLIALQSITIVYYLIN